MTMFLYLLGAFGIIFIFLAIAITEFLKRKEIKEIENNPELPRGLAERMINAVKKKYDDQLWMIEVFKKFFNIFK